MLISTKKNNSKKSLLNAFGFTMIEMLVAITIFVVAITSATAIFIAVVNSQSKSNAQRQTMQDGRYTMETITREVRMATGTDTEPAIKVDPPNKLIVTTKDNLGVIVTKEFEYHPDSKTITVNNTRITSDNIEVTEFKLENFISLDQYDPDGVSGSKDPPRQPSVTITIKTKQVSGHQQSATTLRTTISSRDYLYSQ